MPDWQKFIAGKIALAKKGNQLGKPNANIRVPARQTQVTNFRVLDIGINPTVTKEEWSLRVYGLVENELHLDWAAF